MTSMASRGRRRASASRRMSSGACRRQAGAAARRHAVRKDRAFSILGIQIREFARFLLALRADVGHHGARPAMVTTAATGPQGVIGPTGTTGATGATRPAEASPDFQYGQHGARRNLAVGPALEGIP